MSLFTAEDMAEEFCEAVDALDAALELTRPDAARLLVIVSDGYFTPDQRDHGQQRITRLTATGCAVLWLALDVIGVVIGAASPWARYWCVGR